MQISSKCYIVFSWTQPNCTWWFDLPDRYSLVVQPAIDHTRLDCESERLAKVRHLWSKLAQSKRPVRPLGKRWKASGVWILLVSEVQYHVACKARQNILESNVHVPNAIIISLQFVEKSIRLIDNINGPKMISYMFGYPACVGISVHQILFSVFSMITIQHRTYSEKSLI